MSLNTTPKGLRLHIAILGRRNVGKSSLLNRLTNQNVSIVSEYAGTTTDPVEKPMELLPFGPVLFIDTAGIDDVGALGELRIKKTEKVLDRADIVLLVIEGNTFGKYEEKIIKLLKEKSLPFIIVVNKIDTIPLTQEVENKISNYAYLKISSKTGEGVENLKNEIIKNAPDEFINNPTIVGDLVPSGGLILLVVPIDLEAPKGRLILPQVQVIRDILDNDAYAMIVKERELPDALNRLNKKPDLVVCDSQVVLKVAGYTPDDIPLTTFSILFARFKGDLIELVKGVKALDQLENGAKILIAEACTHHPIEDDIGRVKIPRWIKQYTGKNFQFEVKSGYDFPEDLNKYNLIIHCGSCMLNRKLTLNRIYKAKAKNIPITNYGVTISYVHGVLKRALSPFPIAYEIFAENK